MAGFRIGRDRPAQQPPQPGHGPGRTPGHAPSYDDAPGHTRAFAVDDAPDGPGYGYQTGHQGGYPGAPHSGHRGDHQGARADARHGYGDGNGNGPGYGGGYPGGYGEAGGLRDQEDGDPRYAGRTGDTHVGTYRAGQAEPPMGPRLHWRDLLSGIVLRPSRTFWQMRDYQVWGPALLVTFVYGLLAVFGFDSARSDVLDSSTAQSIPWVLSTAVAVVISGLVMGAVTHTLARQFGGDGNWAPTIGLAMLITSMTDAPRLLFAIFLGGANGFVQIVGWITWLACAALLTSMVATSHDLRWPKALGACSIQLIALLVLFKLPTL